jgi:hypothetical protein
VGGHGRLADRYRHQFSERVGSRSGSLCLGGLETNAETAQAAAEAAQAAAATSATAAATSATNAATSATASATSATNSANSATAAAASATAADASADAAAVSETNAAASAASFGAHTALTSGVHGTTGDVVGTTDTQTLTNKTISGASNTITDVPDAALSSNVVTLTGAQVLTNKDIDGGTASNTSRLTVPKATKAVLDALARKEGTTVYATDLGKLYVDNGASLLPVGSGGSGGVNFIGLDTAWAANNTDDRDFENSVGNWAAFADAASSTPTDLTGGSPTITMFRSTTAAELLNGAGTGQVIKGASNCQGQGVSVPFNVPPAYQGKPCRIRFPYKLLSGSLATGDVFLAVYDVTNSRLLTLQGGAIDQGSGTALAHFTSSPSAGTPANQQYRLGIYFGSTATTAATIAFDDVTVEPVDAVQVPNVTAWQTYTPAFTGFGTVNTQSFRYRQNGDCIEIEGRFTMGTVTATEARISLPNGLTSASDYSTLELVGPAIINANATTYFGAYAMIEPSVTYLTLGRQGSTQNALSKSNGSDWGNNAVMTVNAKVRCTSLRSSAAAVIVNPNIGPWQTYTPTFTGMGTVNTHSFRWRQVGECIEIEGRCTTGTVSATEARVSLPNGFVSSSSYSTLELAGLAGSTTDQAPQYSLIEPSVSYLTFGKGAGAGAVAKQNGSNLWSTGCGVSVNAKVRVQGLSAAGVINNNKKAWLSDQKASGTVGGTPSGAAWNTRALNTETDSDGFVTLSANQFTLPAGKYRMRGVTTAYQTGAAKARIRNITDGTTALVGMSALSGTTSSQNIPATVEGEFTIAGSKTFELQMYATSTTGGTSGLGSPGSTGEVEIYSMLEIEQVNC